jgi:hypothetical protein
LASMAHRVAKGLVGGCALLLGVAVAGCGAPQYTYIANSNANTYFKVPYSWHKISPPDLASEYKTVTGSATSAWMVAYEPGSNPTAGDFLSFASGRPFVFAEIGQLTSAGSQGLSYDSLRDLFGLPVSAGARQSVPTTFPLTGFQQLRDEVLTPGHQGVHGVRETFNYTDPGVATDTFDEVALTNADQTEVYLLVIHCTTTCYSTDQAEINDVMTSFTIGSP